jgi:hypothetical protein
MTPDTDLDILYQEIVVGRSVREQLTDACRLQRSTGVPAGFGARHFEELSRASTSPSFSAAEFQRAMRARDARIEAEVWAGDVRRRHEAVLKEATLAALVPPIAVAALLAGAWGLGVLRVRRQSVLRKIWREALIVGGASLLVYALSANGYGHFARFVMAGSVGALAAGVISMTRRR